MDGQKKRAAVIFHHNDMDGIAAGNIVWQRLQPVILQYDMVDSFECDYNKAKPNVNLISEYRDYELDVFIVDLSFTINTVSDLLNICNIATRVFWIDHHDDSVSLVKETTYLPSNLEYKVDKSRCGAYLTYVYFTGNNNVPEYIKLVDDWDRFQLKMDDTLAFKYAFDSENYDIDSDIFEELTFGDTLKSFIAKGKTILEYVNSQDEKMAKSNVYYISINNIMVPVINRYGSSRCLGSIYNEKKCGICWMFDGEVYKYSCYSNRDDLKANVIAHYFDKNGGGHIGAAGFRSKELLFKPNEEFTIDMND